MTTLFSSLAATLVSVILVVVAITYAVVSFRNRNRMTIVANPDDLRSQQGFAEYFAQFSECDVVARSPLKCATADAYLSLLVKAPPADDVSFLQSAVDKAIVAIRNARSSSLVNYMKIDSDASRQVLSSIADWTVPWKIAILDERAENGWPHTHGDVICIPRTFRSLKNLVQTLVHERVHLIQRKRPDLFRDLIAIKAWGMMAIPVAALEPADALPFRRSNPDLDGNLYMRKKDGAVPISLFASVDDAIRGGLSASRVHLFKNGREIEDSNGSDQEEHPYETQAYLIAEAIVP